MKSSDATPSSQVQSAIFHMLVESECGYIPTPDGYGATTAHGFAKLERITATTFRDRVKQYKIPHKKPGDTMYVAIADYWSHLPFCLTDGEQEE